ncbi:MAG: hypothetical protein NTW19_02880 [Planctomycetota bacterium]|nr:hypothetical protein [Planctomycetota bacterium]
MPQPAAPGNPGTPGILLTAFEPSGDALAAAMVRQLRAQRPDLPIWGLGGPKMREAGATLLETTTIHASMGAGAAAHVVTHLARLGRLGIWLKEHPIAALVAVDSPGANWSICKLVRKHRPAAKVIHLAAPQIWAWAPWRIGKLRRLTDLVLCLLPFEPAWFEARGVPAVFVGHPLFTGPEALPTPPATQELPADHRAEIDPAWPRAAAGHRLALLPGSRTGEITANFPTMLAAFDRLRERHAELAGVVAAVDAGRGKRIEELIAATPTPGGGSGGGRRPLHVAVGQVERVLAWADVVLVVSGTATLQVASYRKPMVALYNTSWLQYQLIGRWIIYTRTFTLPNLIAEADGQGRAMTELAPHFGAVGPVVEAVDRLLSDPAARAGQTAALQRVCAHFANRPFGELATNEFLRVTGL